jgi:hypothetical protein
MYQLGENEESHPVTARRDERIRPPAGTAAAKKLQPAGGSCRGLAHSAINADVNEARLLIGRSGWLALEEEGPTVDGETRAGDAIDQPGGKVAEMLKAGDGLARKPADGEKAGLQTGWRISQKVHQTAQVRKGRVELLPSHQTHAEAVFDQPDGLVFAKAIDMASAFEHVAIDRIAEAVAVGEREEASAGRGEDASHLGERGIDVVDVLERMVADDQVEGRVGEGDRIGAGTDRGAHRWVFVERDDLAAERCTGKTASAGADIEHALIGPHPGDPIVDVEHGWSNCMSWSR